MDKSTASKDVVARSDQEFHNRLIEGSNHHLENSRGETKSKSNSGKVNKEPMLEAPGDSINLDTRTKTTHFSHNGCSEEVMMNANHIPPLKTVMRLRRLRVWSQWVRRSQFKSH